MRASTDLLVHEIGGRPRHADRDSRTEFRTPALWGIGATTGPYMHDGSPTTIEQAVLKHGGEAATARAHFIRLPQEDKERLNRFVRGR